MLNFVAYYCCRLHEFVGKELMAACEKRYELIAPVDHKLESYRHIRLKIGQSIYLA